MLFSSPNNKHFIENIKITITAPLKLSSESLRFHFYRQTGMESVKFT